jgi:hypothetical protein
MYQRGSRWVDFREISYSVLLQKSVKNPPKFGQDWTKISGTLHEDVFCIVGAKMQKTIAVLPQQHFRHLLHC